MDKQQVLFKDLGIIDYKAAWDYQEELVKANVALKAELKKSNQEFNTQHPALNAPHSTFDVQYSPFTIHHSPPTTHHLLFCEHLPVYTLGKSGSMNNVLLTEQEMEDKEIEFFKTNRGGDITFHGLQQVVGYPVLDLEKFYTDIGKYLRDLEEIIILTIGEYGVKGERSNGETGVWIEPGIKGKERKICAMGIRCSRWITMHGFALNVNTDLSYFDNIIPCGIQNKKVTSMQKELGAKVDYEQVKQKLKYNFQKVFNVQIVE